MLYFNYYEQDKLLFQENMQKQDKYEIQYFLLMHGHIMYQHDITTSYQGSGTIFSIFTPT